MRENTVSYTAFLAIISRDLKSIIASFIENPEFDKSIEDKVRDAQEGLARVVGKLKEVNAPLSVKKDTKNLAYEIRKFNRGFKLYVKGEKTLAEKGDDSGIKEAEKVLRNSLDQVGKVTNRIILKLKKEL